MERPRVYVKHSDQFRADAIAMVARSDRPMTQVAADLGVNVGTLRSWYDRSEMVNKKKRLRKAIASASLEEARESESVEERLQRLERENEALQKENAKLRLDREILKKAAAFFAKESE
jgi:transposase